MIHEKISKSTVDFIVQKIGNTDGKTRGRINNFWYVLLENSPEKVVDDHIKEIIDPSYVLQTKANCKSEHNQFSSRQS